MVLVEPPSNWTASPDFFSMTMTEPVPFKYVPYDLVKQQDMQEEGETKSMQLEKDRVNVDNGSKEVVNSEWVRP